jgi:hypothetical protein
METVYPYSPQKVGFEFEFELCEVSLGELRKSSASRDIRVIGWETAENVSDFELEQTKEKFGIAAAAESFWRVNFSYL